MLRFRQNQAADLPSPATLGSANHIMSTASMKKKLGKPGIKKVGAIILIVSVVVTLFTLRFIFSPTPTRAGSTSMYGSPICSHRLNLHKDAKGPVTKQEFITAWSAIVEDAQVPCIDLDITRIRLRVATGSPRFDDLIVIGHPTDLEAAAAIDRKPNAASKGGLLPGGIDGTAAWNVWDAFGLVRGYMGSSGSDDATEEANNKPFSSAKKNKKRAGEGSSSSNGGGSGDEPSGVLSSSSSQQLQVFPIQPRMCMTVELKGDLGGDISFLEQLAATAAESLSAKKNKGASSSGTSNKATTAPPPPCFAVLGLSPAITPPPGLGLAYEMRNAGWSWNKGGETSEGEGNEGTKQEGAVSSSSSRRRRKSNPALAAAIANDPRAQYCGVVPGESTKAFAARLSGYSVLMPSMECMRYASSYIQAWRRLAQSSSSVGGNSPPALLPRDVRVWTVDTCAEAKEMLSLGGTHVISNNAVDLKQTCDL